VFWGDFSSNLSFGARFERSAERIGRSRTSGSRPAGWPNGPPLALMPELRPSFASVKACGERQRTHLVVASQARIMPTSIDWFSRTSAVAEFAATAAGCVEIDLTVVAAEDVREAVGCVIGVAAIGISETVALVEIA
jgi:hypothetical protein